MPHKHMPHRHSPLCAVSDKHRRSQLERELQRERVPDTQRREYLDKLEARERDYTRLQRQRLSAADFEPLTIIGRGAFGEVRDGLENLAG
jgi:serine/threonine kinase 38